MRTILAVLCVAAVAGCVVDQARPPALQLSQVEARQLQTRVFEGRSVLDGMKAVSAALQDEGYSIETVNTDLGLVTASRTVDDVDRSLKGEQVFWRGFAKDYRTARKWVATANIQNIEGRLSIRISLLEQELSETGGIMYSQPVTISDVYQALFSKVDKSVFLQRSKL